MTECDVLVIGAGPAGSIAATLLARSGLCVRLVEKKRFPRRKICGACLSGYAIAGLERVGLGDVLAENDAVPLSAFRLAANSRAATVPLRAGYVLSRSRLDAALATEAVVAGVEFEQGVTAEVGADDGEARTVTLAGTDAASVKRSVRAKVVIVAAGLTGVALRHDPALRSGPTVGARIGAGTEVSDAPSFCDPGTIFMATGRAGYVGLVRTEEGALNVAAALDPRFVLAAGGLGPAAEAIVRRAGFSSAGFGDSEWTGTPPLTRRPAALSAPRVFLIGDAAGYVEPFTGEGIGWSVASAVAVAPIVRKAVARWSPVLADEWAVRFGDTIGRRQRLCRVVARALRSPAAVSAAVHVLEAFPAVASPVLRHLAAT